MLISNVSAVIVSLCIIIAVVALALFGTTLALYRGGQRECRYRQKEAHKLIGEAEESHAGEVRALAQRDSVIASLDETTKELAEARRPQPFREEVLTQAFELAALCYAQPASPKAKNVLTSEKLEQLYRVCGAVEAYNADQTYHLARRSGYVNTEVLDQQYDDWTAKFAAVPVATVHRSAHPNTSVSEVKISLGGQVARPAPLGTLTNDAMIRTKGA